MTFSHAYDLFIILIGALLLLWRVGQMDRHYAWRVLLLTAVLSSFFLYLFCVFPEPTPYDYDQFSNSGNQF
ncbi:MAG TPA: hypothetical protein VIX17_22530 [Pyrinomonadaceae bacterium]